MYLLMCSQCSLHPPNGRWGVKLHGFILEVYRLFVCAQSGLDARVDCCMSPSHHRQPITAGVLAAAWQLGLANASIMYSATPQTMKHVDLRGGVLRGLEFTHMGMCQNLLYSSVVMHRPYCAHGMQ